MNQSQKGLMKGLIKTGIVFSAVLVTAITLFYVLPVFASPGVTLTRVAPSPVNASNVSTVGLARGYFYVNVTSNESFISIPNLEVYNISGGGAVANYSMNVNGTDASANYVYFNVTGLFNGTFAWRVVGVNTSSLGANQTFGNFTVTLGQIYDAVITNPSNNTNTANDLTPEIRVSANSTFLTNLSLTLYTNKAGVIQAIRNTTILNGTETAFNLSQLTGGTYNIIAELGNSADFTKINSTALTIVVTYLEANATLDVSSVQTGKEQNYTFTVANNGTDTIDRINITYNAEFEDPVAGDIVCPTTTSLWNRSVDATNNMVSCIMPDRAVDSGITTGNSKTIKVENWSAPNDARVKTFFADVRGLKNGNASVVANMPSVSVFGNLSITGTSRVASTTETGSTNVTIISFNFSATGEQMNITGINVTLNGTGLTTADIVRVALINSTKENAQTFNETPNLDQLQWNISEPVVSGTTLRYNFSNIVLNVNTSQIVMVVVNLSSSATGGRTFNASIEGAADVVTTGGHSGQAITETFATQRSSSSTIYGKLSATGTNRVNASVEIGTNRITLVSWNLTTTGEAMNVSEILVSLNGTSFGLADVKSVELYNSTDPSTTIVNGSQTLIMTNNTGSGDAGATYNFTRMNLSVPTGTTGQILLLVVNISGSATGGHSINGTIISNSNIVTRSAVSDQNIAETLATANSNTAKIFGNLTIRGTSRVASSTQIGTKNLTVISFNFSATGENMNISWLNLTINGSVAVTDIYAVGLYNSSAAAAGVLDGSGVNYDLIQWNTSLPVNPSGNVLRYNFSNIGFNVTGGTTNVLLVVFNVTDWAIGGHTFNASIEGAADVVTTGGGSGLAITETFISQRSGTSTINGNLSVTGASIAPAGADVGQIGVGILKLTLNATGEAINVTSINVTSNNTRNQDILLVRLFDDTDGATTGTYERGVDSPIAGASGVFGGSSGGSVLLTPTAHIRTALNSLSYVYVVFDINTSATAGLDRLGASIQASAITAQGNNSLVSLTPQLIIGDPGAVNVDIRNLTATSSAITTGTSVARSGVGTMNNYTVTVNNTATGSLKDSIDEIRILYGGTGFTLLGNATCPTIGSVPWNRTILSANTVVCNVTDSGGRLAADTNTTVSLENFTASGTAGIYQLNISVRGALGGVFNATSNPSVTIYGNLTSTGTNRVNATTAVGSNSITLISYNLSANGESANVSEFVLTVNGTAVSTADIQSITLFNSTRPDTTIVNGSQTLLMTNVSASEDAGSRITYNFSRLNLSVPTGTTGQILLVVMNISGSATGGRKVNGTVLSDANMVTVGGLTAVGISENLSTQASSSTTIFGNLTVFGASRVSSTTAIGTTNVTIISFNFSATGENMNITGINITINGTSITGADIVRVGLYNSSAAAAGVLDGSGVNYNLIQWNISEPVKPGDDATLRYNFSNIGFNVTGGTPNVLLVVVNISSSATGGRTFNASIEGAGDIVTTSGTTNLAITETFANQRSSSSTIGGSLSITGTNRVAAYTRLGTNNVTMISFNFSATGEIMRIAGINITFNGTHTTADIARVGLYNSTLPNAGVFNGTVAYDLIQWNTSAPVSGRYNFSNIGFNISSGGSNTLLVVVNISSSATGGLTFNASIEGAADVVTTGGSSSLAITETLTTTRSSTSTLVSLNVSTGTLAPGTISANQTATAMLNITVTASGETMNITSFNFTLTGNATAGNISDVRLYRDDAAPLGAFTSADTYLETRAAAAAAQLNLTVTNYNLSVSTGSTIFFITYNISGGARSGATAGLQLTPSGIAAIGNASGLAISVTGNSVASANATVQSEASLSFGSITSSYPWITNKTTTVNTTNISIPVTNGGQATATLTSVLVTFYNVQTGENASTNFTVVRADSVTSIAGGVTTTLNFTVNATTGAQFTGRLNASVMLRYNDSNAAAAVTAGPVETNTSALFGLDSTLPVISIVNPANSGNASGGIVDINFTLNDTGSGINRSAIAISINSVARNATCSPSGLNFTCNFSLSSSDSLYVFGTITARITNITDNATNSASAAEINFTLNNNDGVANLTRPIVGASPYDLGWNTIQIPTQTIMEQSGRNATNTGDFNFTSIMASMGTSWTHMYYNINGSSTGWVLATRTDFAGSTLKYLNNTNANPYWVNMTSRGMVFKI